MTVQITLNGRPQPVDEGTNVAQLLESQGVKLARVVVQLNRQMLPRDQYGATLLQAGDVVEIVPMIGGGA